MMNSRATPTRIINLLRRQSVKRKLLTPLWIFHVTWCAEEYVHQPFPLRSPAWTCLQLNFYTSHLCVCVCMCVTSERVCVCVLELAASYRGVEPRGVCGMNAPPLRLCVFVESRVKGQTNSTCDLHVAVHQYPPPTLCHLPRWQGVSNSSSRRRSTKKKFKTPKLAAELRFASPLVICPGAQQPVDLHGLSKWNSLYLILCQAVLTNREVAVRFHTLDGV